jgi:hypothetical protein
LSVILEEPGLVSSVSHPENLFPSLNFLPLYVYGCGVRLKGQRFLTVRQKKYVLYTRWFRYDRDDLCVNKSQFVPVIFEPSCIWVRMMSFPPEGFEYETERKQPT